MLGIDTKIQIKETEYPIMFESNECVHCGCKDSLVMIDKYDRIADMEVHPLDHMKCTNCGRIFSIKWVPSKEDHKKMIPVAVEPSIARQFNNFITQIVK